MGVAPSFGGRSLAGVVVVCLARVGSGGAVTRDEPSPHRSGTSVERNTAS